MRDYENVFKIFIYAPIEYRIDNVMQIYGDNLSKAKENITRSDNARAKYYKNISGNDWGDGHKYNLCIDSSIGVESTANIICDYINNLQQCLKLFYKYKNLC